MDSIESSRAFADLIVRLLLVLPPVYFLVRALSAESRSRRLANFALLCGLLALTLPEDAICKFAGVSRSPVLLVSGVARVALACTGIVLAVFAFRARGDGGVSGARPIFAGILSALHLLSGVGMLIFGSVGTPGTPWVYQFKDGLWSMTLPSKSWQQVADPSHPGRITFVHPRPYASAIVMEVIPNQSEEDYTRIAADIRKSIEANLGESKRPEWRQVTNAAKNPCQYVSAVEKPDSNQPVFVAQSTTWCRQKNVVVEIVIECPLTMRSEIARSATLEAMQRDAEAICMSVE